MKTFFYLLNHEIRLQLKQKTENASLLLFFIIIIILIPFALGPEPDMLRRIAPGLIWIAALLMSLLSLDHLFVRDARDGTLDEMLTSSLALELIVLAKILAHIVILILALLIISLPALLLFNVDIHIFPSLVLTFLLGIPSLILLGGIAAALTIALNRNAALLTLLLIPFYVPILIFSVSACNEVLGGDAVTQPLLFLAAILALLLPTAPFIIAASLKS